MSALSPTDPIITQSMNAPGPAEKFKALKELAKSGIVTLVLISVGGGYLLGHRHETPMEWDRLFLTLLGILFLSSGSSALNQTQERKIDASMKRTAGRPLPSGRITLTEAVAFVVFAQSIGLLILFQLDPWLGWLGCFAAFSYNVLYTLWWKPRWAYAAVPGAIPGALPILMGYYSASRDLLAPGGWYLFAILVFWQMPHFWVLALKYKEDYRSGGFPTLPVAHGSVTTVRQIVVWCLGYVAIGMMAPLFIKLDSIYLVAATLVSGGILWELLGFARAPESKSWLRFFLWINFSLILYLAAAVVDVWAIYLIPLIWG